MRAALMHSAVDVRVKDVPDCRIKHPTDALVERLVNPEAFQRGNEATQPKVSK